jgi:preprotein translocase subunit SecA
MYNKFFGSFNKENSNIYKKYLEKINNLENEIELLTENDIKIKVKNLIINFQKNKNLDNLLVESFALTREASKRTLGLRHFDVQLMAGIVLHNGKIAEMKTGEGKTLAATLAAVLNSLSLNGVQIVTVNDYLAKRDKQLMSQLYRYLGLSIGLIQENMNSLERRKNYSADITYVTNSELVFDYLRDNLVKSIKKIVLPKFNYCIIDEVDSILIDEARTPLIISRTLEGPFEKYITSNEISNYLTYQHHFTVNEKIKNITLTSEGIKFIEQMLSIESIYDINDPWFPFINNALKAKIFYKKNINYIIENEEILIIDESTGRIMSDRRWSDGLHEAIEAKEHVVIRKGSEILSSLTYQNFFLSYPKFAGMSGTAKTSEDEFEKIYNLSVFVIPTQNKMIRNDLKDFVYKDEFSKWKAVAKEVAEIKKIGRPILLGTTSIEKSQIISELLKDLNIKHRLLNAQPENIKLESEIIAQAGKKFSVTVATNMAGRGTDILLGGNPDFQTRQQIFELLNQLNNNKFFFLLIKKNLSKKLLGRKKDLNLSSLLLISRELEIKIILNFFLITYIKLNISLKIFLKNSFLMTYFDKINIESNIINVIENGYPFSKNLIDSDLKNLYNFYFSINKENCFVEKNLLKKLGGLFVIGTEHHESLRIDNQLRGRSGRQGDPGSSRFFVSLDDNLLRIFGGQEIKKLLQKFDPSNSLPLDLNFLDNIINNSQKKVEESYYETRKNLLEYDKIIHTQRMYIYKIRNIILNSINLKEEIVTYGENLMFKFAQTLEKIKRKNLKDEFLAIQKEINFLLSVESIFLDFNHLKILTFEEIYNILIEQFWITYDLKEEQLETIKPGLMRIFEKKILLAEVDKNWKLHLQKTDIIKETIGWRTYGQLDPLLEYNNEASKLFVATIYNIKYNSLYEILQSKILFDKKINFSIKVK